MILCDGTDTRAAHATCRDPMAVILDHAAGHHDMHDECWIVSSIAAEFFGRRILFTRSAHHRQPRTMWSRRCDSPEQARQVAAASLGVAVDDMVVR